MLTTKLSAHSRKLEELTELDENATVGSGEESQDDEGHDARKSSTTTSKKRARVCAADNASPAKKTSRRRRDLSLLPTMPLDILFEIFDLLHPKDILALSRTNKLFRDTLLSKNAITIWKKALKNTNSPGCPTYLTEPKWAALFFGNTCQNCNAKNIQKADFALRRRICTACKKEKLNTQSSIIYPGLDSSYQRYCLVGGWAQGHSTKSRFFWRDDIDAMVKELAQYQHDIHMRRPNSHKNPQDFVARQKALVEDVLLNLSKHQNYYESIVEERDNAVRETILRRQNAIRQRFVELGYTENDIEACRYEDEFRQKKDLSERIWIRIRPILEPFIIRRKELRLMRELEKIQENRRLMVHGLYDAYKRRLKPSQWLHLPQTYEICGFSPFAQIIDLPADAVVTPENFQEAMQKLPNFFPMYWDDKRASRSGKIPAPSSGTSSASASVDPLDLATSVFKCRSYSTLGTIVVGTEAHMTHTCMSPGHGLPSHLYYGLSSDGGECLSFSADASATARLLIGLARLDPNTTTVSDMDNSGVRFSCSSCPASDFNGVFMHFGYSWRSAILHSLKGHPSGGSILSVLSKIDAASMKQVEQREREAKHDITQWTCNHCPEDMDQPRARSVVVDHIQKIHQIQDPKEPDDLFFFDRTLSGPARLRFPPDRSVKPIKSKFLGAKVHCVHCATVSQKAAKRLFTDNGIVSHLLEKHSVHRRDMKEGVDYKRPQS